MTCALENSWLYHSFWEMCWNGNISNHKITRPPLQHFNYYTPGVKCELCFEVPLVGFRPFVSENMRLFSKSALSSIDYIKQNLALNSKKQYVCLCPSSFLQDILLPFVAQLLGAVAWLQSQQRMSIRSDLRKPLELCALCASPSQPPQPSQRIPSWPPS